MVTLEFDIIKRCESRTKSWSYKYVRSILDELKWEHQKVLPGHLIITATKSFSDRASAIAGRKEFEKAMSYKKIAYRLKHVQDDTPEPEAKLDFLP